MICFGSDYREPESGLLATPTNLNIEPYGLLSNRFRL